MSRLPEDLLAYLREPRHVGPLEGEAVRRGEARNPACRDHLVLFIEPDDAGRVGRAAFQATGCPACLAMGSATTELVVGLPCDAGLPDAAAAAHEARFGPPAALHRHALAMVREALGQAVG